MASMWPDGIFPSSATFHLVERLQQGARPFTGAVQRLYLPGRWFVSEMSFDRLGHEKANRLDALIATARAGAIDVPVFRQFAPAAGDAREYTDWSQPFSDGSLFSDGSGWNTTREIEVVDAAAVGDTMLLLRGFTPLQPAFSDGDIFGLPGGRVYEVAAGADCRADAEGECLVQFAPGLRQAVNAADLVEARAPLCRMFIADTVSASRNLTTSPHFTPYTIQFIEDLIA
jgi:hypothetical protein